MSSSWLQAGHSTFISGHLSARCPQPLHSHHVLPAVGERRFLNVMFEALCDFVHGERVRLHLIADRRISSQTTSLAPNQVWESKANINLSPFKTFFSFLFFFSKGKNSRHHLSTCAFQTGTPSQSQCGPPEPWSRPFLAHMWVLPLVLQGALGLGVTEAYQNYSHGMGCP